MPRRAAGEEARSPAPMKALLRVFPAAHLVISTLFMAAALGLMCFSGYELWLVVAPAESTAIADRLAHVLDAIALLSRRSNWRRRSSRRKCSAKRT